MVELVADQSLRGGSQGPLNAIKLLGRLKAGTARFHHANQLRGCAPGLRRSMIPGEFKVWHGTMGLTIAEGSLGQSLWLKAA